MMAGISTLARRETSKPTAGEAIRVVLGGDSLAMRRSGIGRVTLELAKELRRRDGIGELRLWVGERLRGLEVLDELLASGGDAAAGEAPRPSRIRILASRLPGLPAARSALRLAAVDRELRAMRQNDPRPIVYHEPNMIAKPFSGVTVVQMNDLSWLHHPELHPAERLRWIERHLDRTMRQAARFVALSEFTAEGLQSEFGVARSRIDVVPCAASDIFQPRSAEQAAASLARHALTDGRYVLSVSTLEPRKNFDRLVEAHAALPDGLRRDFPLVIAGGSGWGTTLSNETAERSRRDGTLRLLGHVPDHDLVGIMARAAVFIYPSLYEGFGLPVLEAMATGAPVIASSTTATCETAGYAARLVDPLDPDAMTAAIREILEDPDLRGALSRRGLRRASEFTWAGTVEGLMATWRRSV